MEANYFVAADKTTDVYIAVFYKTVMFSLQTAHVEHSLWNVGYVFSMH